MSTPNISCKIEAYCSVNPSEDPKKVEQAISNILLDAETKITKELIKGSSVKLSSLKKIFETIQSHKIQNAYRRQLNQNLKKDTTWFYLNKQAAFVDIISLCEEIDESPLGPITIKIQSRNVEQIIDWLIRSRNTLETSY